MSTDRAILAALTSLEAKEIKTEALDESLIEREVDSSNEEWPEPGGALFEETVRELVQAVDDGLVEALEEDMREFRYADDEPHVHAVHTLAYVLALLRYYRPEFNNLPREERVALLKEALRRVNNFLKGLRQLEAFLEYGAPERDLRPRIEDAAGDIRAAELRVVEGLSNREIGEVLGIAPSQTDLDKGDNAKARTRADRGERLLISSLGEEGWRKLVEAKRAQRDHYQALSEEEQELVQFAEQEGLTLEQARERIDWARSEWEAEE